jgi:hypothetical protein
MPINKQIYSHNYANKKKDKRAWIEIKLVEGQNKIYQVLKTVLKKMYNLKSKSL